MALQDSAVKGFRPKKKMYKKADGKGLHLRVTPSGSKLWVLDYSFLGKRKTFSIGSYPEVSLATAREERRRLKQLIKDGVDPVRDRLAKKAGDTTAATYTFGVAAQDWLNKQEGEWTPGHTRTVRGRLDKHLLPYLNKYPLIEIDPPMVLRVLRRIENKGAIETARRCCTICSQIFQFGIGEGYGRFDVTREIRSNLKSANPKAMAAITKPDQVGGLLRAINDYIGDQVTKVALKLAAYTFVRPGELRRWEWSEVEWIKKEWHIPASKMKMKRDHIVPLSDQAFELLQEIYSLTGEGQYVFPSARSGSRPMSDNCVLSALRRMHFSKEEMSGHGFRAMASTLMNELEWDSELIELQLAHVQGKVQRAYNRARKLKARKQLMQDYADYLDELRDGPADTKEATG